MTKKTNIEFEQLRFVVKHEILKRSEKVILKNINGEFRGCELTGIVGPSGSGKTSLLNILSGFVSKNVFGSIRINGDDRHDNLLTEQSTYIMQEENLHSMLTVREAMNFAVKLKTGNAYSRNQRREKIASVLTTLGLVDKLNDYSGDLSGGERKRLSIALELVDDPPILFLDEPTTGLDSSSSTQCIKLLKNLAQEGKTIVCTIHSPSALLVGMFDHLYALADGCCIYQGSSINLVPFLTELNLICPETFNPCDFLLEIATNAYGSQNKHLIKKINNGLNEHYRSSADNNNECANHQNDHKNFIDIRPLHSSSFVTQFRQLMLRNFLFLTRDRMYLWIRALVHLSVGLMIGFIYYDIGHDATQIFNIFRFIPIAIGFLAYSGFYSLMVRFPLELPITKREHFNRWYSSGAYYLALFISDIPVTISCCTMYTFIIYFLTNQPMETFRLLNVTLIGILTCFSAQAYGMLIGAMFVNIQVALSAAALWMATSILFGGFFILMKDVPAAFHWIFESMYVKHSLDGFGSLLLGYNRTKLDCNAMYCHFQSTQKFMDFIGLEENLLRVFFAIAITLLVLHTATYFVMRYRLRN